LRVTSRGLGDVYKRQIQAHIKLNYQYVIIQTAKK
jgi:hypothetical protein